MQPEFFLELDGACLGDCLEFPVERRWRHVDLMGKVFDKQGFPEVFPQPEDCPGDLVALGAEGVRLPEEFSLPSLKDPVMDFLDDERCQERDVIRSVEQVGKAVEGCQDIDVNLADGNVPQQVFLDGLWGDF